MGVVVRQPVGRRQHNRLVPLERRHADARVARAHRPREACRAPRRRQRGAAGARAEGGDEGGAPLRRRRRLLERRARLLGEVREDGEEAGEHLAADAHRVVLGGASEVDGREDEELRQLRRELRVVGVHELGGEEEGRRLRADVECVGVVGAADAHQLVEEELRLLRRREGGGLVRRQRAEELDDHRRGALGRRDEEDDARAEVAHQDGALLRRLLLVVGVGGGVLRVGVVAEQEGDGELGELRVGLGVEQRLPARLEGEEEERRVGARVALVRQREQIGLEVVPRLAPPAHLARAVARVAAAAVAVKVGAEVLDPRHQQLEHGLVVDVGEERRRLHELAEEGLGQRGRVLGGERERVAVGHRHARREHHERRVGERGAGVERRRRVRRQRAGEAEGEAARRGVGGALVEERREEHPRRRHRGLPAREVGAPVGDERREVHRREQLGGGHREAQLLVHDLDHRILDEDGRRLRLHPQEDGEGLLDGLAHVGAAERDHLQVVEHVAEQRLAAARGEGADLQQRGDGVDQCDLELVAVALVPLLLGLLVRREQAEHRLGHLGVRRLEVDAAGRRRPCGQPLEHRHRRRLLGEPAARLQEDARHPGGVVPDVGGEAPARVGAAALQPDGDALAEHRRERARQHRVGVGLAALAQPAEEAGEQLEHVLLEAPAHRRADVLGLVVALLLLLLLPLLLAPLLRLRRRQLVQLLHDARRVLDARRVHPFELAEQRRADRRRRVDPPRHAQQRLPEDLHHPRHHARAAAGLGAAADAVLVGARRLPADVGGEGEGEAEEVRVVEPERQLLAVELGEHPHRADAARLQPHPRELERRAQVLDVARLPLAEQRVEDGRPHRVRRLGGAGGVDHLDEALPRDRRQLALLERGEDGVGEGAEEVEHLAGGGGGRGRW